MSNQIGHPSAPALFSHSGGTAPFRPIGDFPDNTLVVDVLASGDTSGRTDFETISKLLARYKGIRLQPGSTYYVNSCITPGSGSTIIAYGATIVLVSGVAGNILRPTSADPTRQGNAQFRGANVHSTLVSLDMEFSDADVGSTVALDKAGAGGNTWWYSKVLAVYTPVTAPAWAPTAGYSINNFGYARPTTPNGLLYEVTTAGTSGPAEPIWPTTIGATVTSGTVVFTCRGAATAARLTTNGLTNATTNKTCQLYATADRCTDITVQGGTWVITEPLLGGNNLTATYRNSFASAWRRVDGLRLIDMTWDSVGDAGSGGRFTVSIADCTYYRVSGTRFVRTGGDGVHITGPASHGWVRDTSGTTADDMCVANMQDSNTPTITDTEGDISDLTIDGVDSNGAWRCVRLYDIGAAGRFTAKKVKIRNISGETVQSMVAVTGSAQPSCPELLIEGVRGRPTQANMPLVEITSTSIGSLTVRDIGWEGSSRAAVGVIKMDSPRGRVLLANIRYAYAGANNLPHYLVYLTGTVNTGTAGLTELVLDQSDNGGVVGSTPYPASPACTPIYFASGSGTGTSDITLIGVRNLSPIGALVEKAVAVPIGRVTFRSCVNNSPVWYKAPASDTVATIVMDNCRGSSTNLVQTSSPVALKLVNSDLTTSGAMVALTGVGATPCRIELLQSQQLGAGTLVSRDGSQSISVSGTSIGVDQTLLTPQDGDIIRNTNASPGNGAGVAIYSAAASKWKNLYSGLTN